ncbi:hypothetical protein [Catenulispora acidiphila]|nr:hypothetical protein [Catenulispora acidiphila]
MKRRGTPTVPVSHVVAYKTPFETRVHFESVPLDVDQAHVVSERPYVSVTAYSWRLWPERQPVEDSWFIEVVAFIPEEAMSALDEALQRLDADIAAGRVVRGTHDALVEKDPFGRREAELELFHRAKIRELQEA